MKKSWVILGAVVAGVLLPPFIVPILFPWSPVNCWHQDINIKTGQARYSRSLWFVTISERIGETPLSEALQGETLDVADVEAWHHANTFSPGQRYSPHYRFHSALVQVKLVDRAFRLLEAGPEEKRAIAREILRLWQTDGDDGRVDPLIDELMAEGLSKQGSR